MAACIPCRRVILCRTPRQTCRYRSAQRSPLDALLAHLLVVYEQNSLATFAGSAAVVTELERHSGFSGGKCHAGCDAGPLDVEEVATAENNFPQQLTIALG